MIKNRKRAVLFSLLLAVLAAVVFFFASEKILFIYDPFTMETSGISPLTVRLKALRNGKLIRSVELNPLREVQLEELEKISAHRGTRTVITSWLYLNYVRQNPSLESYLESQAVYLFGPVFDSAGESVRKGESLKDFFYTAGRDFASVSAQNQDPGLFKLVFSPGGRGRQPEKDISQGIMEGIESVLPEASFSIIETDFSESSSLDRLASEIREGKDPVIFFNRFLSEKILQTADSPAAPSMLFMYMSIKRLARQPVLSDNTFIVSYDYRRSAEIPFKREFEMHKGEIYHSMAYTVGTIDQKK